MDTSFGHFLAIVNNVAVNTGVLLLGEKNRIMNIFLPGVWLQRASGGRAEKVREGVGAC